ncbi:MAG: thiamine pyrophosphate-dependent enzyme, partial [Thermodesulfobacteriota bacterium]
MHNLYNDNLFAPGHTACAGCGEALAARIVLNAAGPNTIAISATGCLEVFSTRYPQSSWEIPWIHSLFENSAAVGSGVAAALKALGREDEARVIAQGGDGGTADIGLQALSGMLERGDDVLYVCYDNEAYMNTG